MPIYEYRCDNGHTLEVMQRMSDEPLSSCTTCRAPVQRVFHPVAVHFKGSGFYTTDYGRDNGKGPDESKPKTASEDASKSSTESSTDSSKGGGSESKATAGSSESKPSKSKSG